MGLGATDRALIEESIEFIENADIDGVLKGLAQGLSKQQRAAVAAHCAIAHAAVLVFPRSVDAMIAELRSSGLSVAGPLPSIVVRDRLSSRYGVPAGQLNVAIVHVHVTANDGVSRMVELFALQKPTGKELGGIAAREYRERNESHIALEVGAPDDVAIKGLRGLLVEHGGLVADGGGYNKAEECTVLYFRRPGPSSGPGSNGQSAEPIGNRRLELRIRGHYATALAEHLVDARTDPATRLLTLMTGAWTTQAVTAAAELGVADLLPGAEDERAPDSIGLLAGRLEVDPDALSRLLRYLASVGLAVRSGESYRLTEMGTLLRRGERHSMRALALMYGGVFYESFGALAHAVRTGREGFAEIFGVGHFDYFAGRPALAELFDSSMAASAQMFEPVPGLADFDGARVVVDVAGGNGELLGQALAHAPHLRGVLFEQAHVLERARERITRAGLADRCDFVSGDFTRSVPASGDVYLLSRILHDWGDQKCVEILRNCAAGMSEGGRLLVVERLLSADGTPSLAVTWDLHMLCNVGGRERTAAEYEGLLAAAGFDLDEVCPLPLGASLLKGRRR